jgi:hypothetical protein
MVKRKRLNDIRLKPRRGQEAELRAEPKAAKGRLRCPRCTSMAPLLFNCWSADCPRMFVPLTAEELNISGRRIGDLGRFAGIYDERNLSDRRVRPARGLWCQFAFRRPRDRQ